MANNNSNTSNRGLGSNKMDDKTKHDIQSKGGQSQGKDNNPANFANDREKAARVGHEGGSK